MRFRKVVGCAVICAVTSLLLTVCDQKAAAGVTGEKQSGPMWKMRFDRYSRLVKDGMSEKEVTDAIGKPTEEQTISGNNSYVFWLYDLGNRTKFQVVFDKNHKVSFSRLYP
jgi:hypothetical protein